MTGRALWGEDLQGIHAEFEHRGGDDADGIYL